jgi:uncharacterized protein with GYD domain
MATYLLFGKYSAEAIKSISPDRTEKAGKLIKKLGGKIESIYALTGEKDLVIIARFSSTEKAIMSSIALCKLTGIAFTTSEAIEVGDFDKLIAGI